MMNPARAVCAHAVCTECIFQFLDASIYGASNRFADLTVRFFVGLCNLVVG